MGGLRELVAPSTVMGLSIYLSMPIILRKKMGSRTVTLLNAAAIGILVFLRRQFGDAAPTIYPGTSNAYVANATYIKQRLIYLGVLVGFVVGFLVNAI